MFGRWLVGIDVRGMRGCAFHEDAGASAAAGVMDHAGWIRGGAPFDRDVLGSSMG